MWCRRARRAARNLTFEFLGRPASNPAELVGGTHPRRGGERCKAGRPVLRVLPEVLRPGQEEGAEEAAAWLEGEGELPTSCLDNRAPGRSRALRVLGWGGQADGLARFRRFPWFPYPARPIRASFLISIERDSPRTCHCRILVYVHRNLCQTSFLTRSNHELRRC